VISVVLPAHLRRLAGQDGPVRLAVPGQPSRRELLDALEAAYPALRGTLRDPQSGKRRAFIRFFACEEDLSLQPEDIPLPAAVCRGDEPLLVIGAIAGG
jgi:molybdopterin synthase sulfur carrier subunit